MKKKILAFLTLLPLVAFNSFLFSDDEDVEAVVVTGSYIKTDREEIDIPVDVFDRGEYGAVLTSVFIFLLFIIVVTIIFKKFFSDNSKDKE